MSRYTVGEIVVWLALAAVLGFALGWLVRELVLRVEQRVDARPGEPDAPVVPEPEPEPVAVAPRADGAPPTAAHVIKAKTRSRIFHPPGSPAYDRTTADIWFTTEEEAVAAGFRKPKNA